MNLFGDSVDAIDIPLSIDAPSYCAPPGCGMGRVSGVTVLWGLERRTYRLSKNEPLRLGSQLMKITLLGTGAPLHPDRAMTGMIVTGPNCAPLLIDTCGGLELARQLELVGFD